MPVFGGKRGGARDLDLFGNPLVADRFGIGEVVGKLVDVGLARRDQNAIAADHAEVRVEAGAESLYVVMLNGFVRSLPGGAYFGLGGIGLSLDRARDYGEERDGEPRKRPASADWPGVQDRV